MIREIQCVDTVRESNICAKRFPLVGMTHRNFSYDRTIPLRSDLVCSGISTNLYRNAANAVALKIFETRSCAIAHITNMGESLIAVRRILGDSGKPAVHPITGLSCGAGHMLAVQIADNVGRIFPAACKRTAIAAAGGQLHLRNGPIRKNVDGFYAALAAEICSVGVTVIEDVPLFLDFFYAAVVVPSIKHGLVCRFIGINMQIAVADDHADKSERPQRGAAPGIAEFMVGNRRVDEIIAVSYPPNGGCLKERKILKAGSGSV